MPEVVKKRMSEGKESTGKTVTNSLILSPYVTKLEYAHCDREKNQWEFVASLDEYFSKFKKAISYGRPDGIRLTFANNDWQVERFLLLCNDIQRKPQEIDKKSSNGKGKNEK